MKNLLFSLFLFSSLGFLPCSCQDKGKESASSESKEIRVGPGPEDMVLDSLHGPARLLVSCSGRRDAHKPYGEILALDLHTERYIKLDRKGEPDSLIFRPHGIYLDQDLLYVISHEQEPDIHPVLIYRVHLNHLEYLEGVSGPLQHSPNALVTGPDGEIYLVNDSGKRGSLLEKALKLKRASVVKLEKQANGYWSSELVASDLGYPAGINRMGKQLFVGDAVLHVIHNFEITGEGLEFLRKYPGLKGNDNIRIYQGQILTPGHVKPFRFIGHAKKSEKLSPVEVFLLDPATEKVQSLFYTDGKAISGGSTALIFQDHLYICQVFEPYILKVKL